MVMSNCAPHATPELCQLLGCPCWADCLQLEHDKGEQLASARAMTWMDDQSAQSTAAGAMLEWNTRSGA